MKLYSVVISGNCWKVRLLLSMLGVEHELVDVNLRAGEQKTPEFLALNPLGQVPVLCDGDVTLRDSQAILVYLALRCPGGTACYPDDVALRGEIQSWLSFAASECRSGPAFLRANRLFGRGMDEAALRAETEKVFALVNDQLQTRSWLVGNRPSIADLAVFPYLWLSPDGGFDPATYPAVSAWMQRIEALTGFEPAPRQGAA